MQQVRREEGWLRFAGSLTWTVSAGVRKARQLGEDTGAVLDAGWTRPRSQRLSLPGRERDGIQDQRQNQS